MENKNIFTEKFAAIFGLSAISSTQRAVSGLIELGIVEKLPSGFEFTDPFFQRYIQLRILAQRTKQAVRKGQNHIKEPQYIDLRLMCSEKGL
ncbi:hypothetical protein H8E88_11155 [candidate division KSB1 bacterium]|nr:hypothetical protein [candidate division KSB1 bacterium]MBL7093010.1 hypothetical protein [candidate division KSB1 bacterium]